jgi:hypothetical protein
MKKILFAVALIATLASCSNEPKLYFAPVLNKSVNNPEAEFDTLSYALGMNYALYLQVKAPELQYDNELMAQTYIETFEKGVKSFDEIDQLQKEFGEYQKSHLAEYQNVMRQRMFTRNNEIPLPEIYDEKFTNTMFTSMISRINAMMLLTQNTPYNVHYIAQAIRDAKNVEADSLVDTKMKLTTQQMIKALQQFQRTELSKNIIEQAEPWLAEIATRPNVDTLNVNGTTIYYRINNPGNEVKPAAKDSIAVAYELYSFRGRLVESTQSRIESFQETIQRIKEDKEITDSVRNVRINMATEQLEKVKSQMMVLDQFRIAAIKHCLPLVGQGGSITIWAPAKLAPRSQQLIAGEPIVINVQLNKVVEGANVTTPVLPKKLPLKPMPGKVSTQPQNNTDKKAMPRTIVPVQPAKQPAPQKK